MLQVNAICVPELQRLTAVLVAVQNAASALLSSKQAWPEEVAIGVALDAVNVYPTSIQVEPSIGSSRIDERGVLLSGTIVQRRMDAGILGERRLPSIAQAMYAAMVLDTIDLTAVGRAENQPGPDADFSCKSASFQMNAGNNGTEILFVAPWTVRMVLRTAYLMGDP